MEGEFENMEGGFIFVISEMDYTLKLQWLVL